MKSRIGETWELLRPHALPRLPILVFVLLLGSVTAAIQASVLLLIAPVWQLFFPDQGDAEQTRSSVSRLFDGVSRWVSEHQLLGDSRMGVLLALSVIALVMAVLAGISQMGYTWFARRIGFQMIVDLRVRIARHLMGLSVRYHSQRKFGDLLSRVSADVQITLQAVNITLKNLVLDPLKALATLGVMIYTAPLPSLGVLLVLPVALLPVLKLSSRVRKGSKKSLTSLGASVQALTQMLQGIRTVKSFGGEERELARYRDLNEGYLHQSMRMVRAIALSHGWTAFTSIAGIGLLVLLVGALQVRLTLFQDQEQILTFFAMVMRLSNHLKDFTKAQASVQESVGASERILALLEESVDVVERADAAPISSIGSGIRFEKVSFTYPGSDRPALSGIDLEIRTGEKLALVGPSGAGKSTLMDLVARFIDPTEGRVVVDGRDLRDVSVAGWTSLYALVGQVPFLFHASIAENIAYGKEGATRAEIEAAARVAGMHEFISSLPHGYDTDVADMGTRLSGGQRQRITIARAVLKGAPLLLLDEATSALDSESEAGVQEALHRLMADRTVLVIAHRISTVQDADRVAVLEDGRLVELGRHEDLIGRGGTYARLCALQNLEAPGGVQITGTRPVG